MELLGICAAMFGAGCFGGLVNALITGELHLPRLDKKARVWRPGWFGNVIVGGTAAVVFWGLYGPSAAAEIPIDGHAVKIALHISELVGGIVSGIGGSRLLTAEIDKRVLKNENDALSETKALLSDALSALSKKPSQ